MKEVKTILTEYQGRKVYNIDLTQIQIENIKASIEQLIVRFNPTKRNERNLKIHKVNGEVKTL